MGELFHENLKAARTKLGMTQKDAAEAIGVAKSTYSLYESGKREPNLTTIRKLADLLSVTADELLGVTGQREAPQTIAAHFDGDDYTEEEMEKIHDFLAYVKSQRK